MNQPMGGQVPPEQPQQAQPAPQQPMGGSGPFEQQAPPQGQGGLNQQNASFGYQPTGMEQPQESGGKTWILIGVLLVILIVGGLVFASWEGWISLGGIEKLWKKSDTTTVETPTTIPTESTTNANDVIRKADLAKIKAALAKYYQANQAYPIATVMVKTADVSNVLTALVPTYLTKLPVDPLSPTKYYGYKSDGKSYELTTALEDLTDPAGIKTGTVVIYKVTNTSTETPTTTTTETTTTNTTDTTTVTPTTTP